ncbi:MAG: ABC transporter permease [Treponema sp.]|nr:ABC transporter permease [Treponema sp.]
MVNILPFLKSTVTIMIPIFFAACGGLFPALAGTLNIALEGLLLIGAFSSLAVFNFTGSAAAAVASAVFAAVLLSSLHAFSVFKLRANLFISGIAVNLLSSGLCIVLSDKIFKTKGVVTADSGADIFLSFIFTGLFLLVISWIAIYKTPFGYRLRACDKNTVALVSLGIKPDHFKIIAILISGVFCGIGGSFLSINLGAYVPEMSAGKGWIALAVIFLGARKPFGILAAALLFAFAESFSNYAQGIWSIPSGLILAFPYVCTLIAMIVVSIIHKKNKI